jgi:aspartate aminotransferase
MPSISVKGANMPSSPIRKLAVYAEAAKKRGTKIYHLNIGQPDIATPRVFWDAVKAIDQKVLAYSPSNGFEALRERYARYFAEKCGIPQLTADDLLITTGASEALFFTMLSILDEGDEMSPIISVLPKVAILVLRRFLPALRAVLRCLPWMCWKKPSAREQKPF